MDERERQRDDDEDLDEDEALDEREPRDEGASLRGVIPDLFRRALISGIGTVFMTEDTIRKSLSDMKMPKEAVGYVVAQADKTKRELIATLSRELRNFLNSLELSELLHDSLQDTTFEIHTTIRVKRDDDGGTGLAIEHKDAAVTRAPREKKSTRASRPRKRTPRKPVDQKTKDDE
jgi:signal transduction histidine kinase